MNTGEYNYKFELLPKEEKGTILLSDSVRVTDPCYDMETWCAGTIKDVLPGEFFCFSQKADTGDWGERVANIEIRHKDYPEIKPTEWVSDLDVGVDSGQCGLFDNGYFSSLCENDYKKDEFYDRVCDLTYPSTKVINPEYIPFEESKYYKPEFSVFMSRPYQDVYADFIRMEELKKHIEKNPDDKNKERIKELIKSYPLFQDYIRAMFRYKDMDYSKKMIWDGVFEAETIDNKGFVSSSGDGDGSYACFVGRNEKGQVVSIKIDYYPDYELLEEKENNEIER